MIVGNPSVVSVPNLITILALCWIPGPPTRIGYQVLINGLKRGVPPKLRYEPKSRSAGNQVIARQLLIIG